MIALGTLAFIIAFALDYADTQHKLAVEARGLVMPGVWSVAMYLMGIVGTWAVLDYSFALVIPTACGLFTGSVVAMRRARKAKTPPSVT